MARMGSILQLTASQKSTLWMGGPIWFRGSYPFQQDVVATSNYRDWLGVHG